jgi:hypothetical protein
MRTFFYQRAGQNKTAAHAGAGWVDGPSFMGALQDPQCRLFSDKNNAATERDLRGGWYDAGDLNKYTSWTAGYVETLLRAYAENPAIWTDDTGIPESGNGIPDVLDEAKWGLDFLVRDAFVEGVGSMLGTVLGLVTVVNVHDTPDITAGALVRFLAEAVWLPTALLPSHGVRWTPLDAASARATLTSGVTTASLDFHFGADGLVERIYTPARGRDVNGTFVPTPWEGRWLEYAERGGLLVPVRGEVAWILPEGPLPYWRGEISDVVYD